MLVATLIPLVTLSGTKLFFSFESNKLTQILQQQQQQQQQQIWGKRIFRSKIITIKKIGLR